MKKTNLLLLIVLVSLFVVSCESKEEKAAELVKNELSKTLYDYESYEPIETKVSEAYQTPYNDTTCFRVAMGIAYVMNATSKAIDEAKEAREHADIWGPPTYYSSSYSDNKYRKYCAEAEEKFWEDETTEYYFSCIKSHYIIVMDNTGRTVDVVTALNEGLITIETLDNYGIEYYAVPKLTNSNLGN